MTLFEWLTWLFNSGGSVMVASWILERIPAYTSIVNAETKKYIFWGTSVLLCSVAFAIITYVPEDILLAMSPYWGFAFGTFGAISLGTAFHRGDKEDQAARNVENK